MGARLPLARPAAAALVALVVSLGPAAPGAAAEVFYARRAALAAAFPGLETAALDLFLDGAQRAEITRRSGLADPPELATAYAARDGAGAVVAYGVFETRLVRSRAATTLTRLTPAGAIERVLVCAFHEPADYLPLPGWLAGLTGRTPAAPPRVGRNLDAVSGATLTARALAGSSRYALALYAVALAPGRAD